MWERKWEITTLLTAMNKNIVQLIIDAIYLKYHRYMNKLESQRCACAHKSKCECALWFQFSLHIHTQRDKIIIMENKNRPNAKDKIRKKLAKTIYYHVNYTLQYTRWKNNHWLICFWCVSLCVCVCFELCLKLNHSLLLIHLFTSLYFCMYLHIIVIIIIIITIIIIVNINILSIWWLLMEFWCHKIRI